MNEMRFCRATLAVLLAAAGAVNGADAQSVKTREQVKAELAEAIRTGNMYAPGESGLLLNEISPQRYPEQAAKRAALTGKTREQVKAELQEAIRTGDIVASGESGLKLNEEFPARYASTAAPVVTAGKSREQVKSETAQAIRAGDVVANNETGMKLNELYPQRYAKEREMYNASLNADMNRNANGTTQTQAR
jgi:lambda repressor-like predicted transcriptional regulator